MSEATTNKINDVLDEAFKHSDKVNKLDINNQQHLFYRNKKCRIKKVIENIWILLENENGREILVSKYDINIRYSEMEMQMNNQQQNNNENK